MTEINRLLPALSSAPSLRLLRWHCKPLRYTPSHQFSSLPQLESLRPLFTAAPLLRVELLLPRTFDEWRALFHSSHSVSAELTGLWNELQQLPAEMPRVSIVDLDSDDAVDGAMHSEEAQL
jgi:hypothetical protein